VGDYLLSSALMRSIQTGNIRIMRIVSEVGRALSEGEIQQLQVADEVVLDENLYLQVIKKKTAILLSACAEIGAISAYASYEQIDACRLFGEFIGYCFQIRDDIFDYYRNTDIGKPTGNDILEGKVTLPLLYALQNKNSVNRDYYKRLIIAKDFTPVHIDELITFAKANGGIEYAESRMQYYHDKAVELLFQLPDSESRTSLLALADFVIKRAK
jgi:octaprenyl-diphosphate synthase